MARAATSYRSNRVNPVKGRGKFKRNIETMRRADEAARQAKLLALEVQLAEAAAVKKFEASAQAETEAFDSRDHEAKLARRREAYRINASRKKVCIIA